MTSPWSQHTRNPSVADDIDFEIKGQELPLLQETFTLKKY